MVISWNDLGMHCYNRDFKDLAVLPLFNNLWAQVIRRRDPPEIVTSGVTVAYSFPDNTYSVGKSNFWDYDLQLFSVDLPADIGLAGKGLSGAMDLQGDHYLLNDVSNPTARIIVLIMAVNCSAETTQYNAIRASSLRKSLNNVINK